MTKRIPKPTHHQLNNNPAAAPQPRARSKRRTDTRPPARTRPAPEIRHMPLAPGGADYLRASVYFHLDDDRLGAAERTLLQQAASAANGRDADLIRVTGHADPSGSEAHNDGLTDRRAEGVVAALDPRLRLSHRDVMSLHRPRRE